MADQKISLMASATALTGTEISEIVQGGVNVKVTEDQRATFMNASVPKVYAARITQSGTGNPTAVVANNTTGATVALTRSAAGFTVATFSSAVLIAGKTIIQYNVCGAGTYVDPKYGSKYQASDTVINFGVFRYSDGSSNDGWVMDLLILIYP